MNKGSNKQGHKDDIAQMSEDSCEQINNDSSESMDNDNNEEMNEDYEENVYQCQCQCQCQCQGQCQCQCQGQCQCQFSPSGTLPQVEYANEATLNSPTAIGMRGRDGIVLAVEKVATDWEPLLNTTGNRSIFTIDQHIGATVAGLMPDARRIVNEARIRANYYRNTYGSPSPLNLLMQDVSAYMHENTLHSNRRPFAASLIFGSYIPDGPQLYCVKPSGALECYNGFALGQAAEEAKSEMENIDFSNVSLAELVKEAVRILYLVHDDDTDFEIELTWCGEVTGGIHAAVPQDVLEEAKNYVEEQNGGTRY